MNANKIMIIVTALIVLLTILSFFLKPKSPKHKFKTTIIEDKPINPVKKPKHPKKKYFSNNSNSSSASYSTSTTEEKKFDPILDFMVNHKMKRELAIMTIEFQKNTEILSARDALDNKNYSKAEILFKKIIKKHPKNLLLLLSAYGGLWNIGKESNHPNKELFKQQYYSCLDQYVNFVNSRSSEIPKKSNKTYNGLKKFKSEIGKYYNSYEKASSSGNVEKTASSLSNKTGANINLYNLKKNKSIWKKNKDDI